MKKYSLWFVLFVLIFTTFACRSGVSTGLPTVEPSVQVIQPTAVVVSPPMVIGDSIQMQDVLVSLYQTISPGVVAIQVVTDSGNSSGSGFVLDQKGHILTNLHVVEGANDLEVDFLSEYKVRGKVIATDQDSDLAVVQVDAPASELKPLRLGDSDQVQVGQTVVAIGNPFGLNGTMTLGIVSAKGRTLDSLRSTSSGQYYTAGDIIQTDAAINPGNSGGPLLNLNGEVIGINRAIRTTNMTAEGEPSNSGIGFAVSINIVKRVINDLVTKGSYDYPYLGVTALPEISLAAQELLGLPQSTGAYILTVTPGGPADLAGLRGGSKMTQVSDIKAGGDLIIAVDGRPVVVFGDLLSYLMTKKSPGDEIILTIIRDKVQKEVKLTLGKRP